MDIILRTKNISTLFSFRHVNLTTAKMFKHLIGLKDQNHVVSSNNSDNSDF